MRPRPIAFGRLARARAGRSGWPSLLARLGVALSFSLLSSEAEAATVALLEPVHDGREIRAALFRLKGELLAVGVEVVMAERAPDDADLRTDAGRARLEQLAAQRNLDALLDVIGEPVPRAIDVWLRDPATPDLRVTRVEQAPGTVASAEALAIHAIEVLRSSFLTAAAPRPARSEPAPARSPQATAPALVGARHRLGFELGAAAIGGVGGVGPSLQPLLRLDFAIASSSLVLQATVAEPGTHAGVPSDAGGVRVGQGFGLLGVCRCPTSNALEPLVALSAGALRIGVEGQADPPDISRRASQWALLLDASVGVRATLSSRLFLTLNGHLQLAQPYVAVRVLDSVVATSGRPNLLLTLTVGAWP